MRRMLLIPALICFLMAGCGLPSDTPPEVSGSSYTISTETYSYKTTYIEYPQIHGLGDDAREQAVNDLIRTDLFSTKINMIEPYDKDTLTMDFRFEVMTQTDELLSVLYMGRSRILGAQFGTNGIFAITIDLKTVTKMKLTDFVTVDESIVEKIKQSTEATNPDVRDGIVNVEFLLHTVRTMLQNYYDQFGDYDLLINELRFEGGCDSFCVAPDAVYVSMIVYHAGGDFALVKIPRE